jgi:hypothetical protein
MSPWKHEYFNDPATAIVPCLRFPETFKILHPGRFLKEQHETH